MMFNVFTLLSLKIQKNVINPRKKLFKLNLTAAYKCGLTHLTYIEQVSLSGFQLFKLPRLPIDISYMFTI